MKDELKVGIVGTNRGEWLIPCFQAIAETHVAGLCDINQTRLCEVADQFGIEDRYVEYEQMVEADLDIIVLGTPMHLHVPQSVMALERNKHVLCEVTAAVSLDQCCELVEAVRSSSAKYMMGEGACYMKPNMLVRSMVERGAFGEVYFAEGDYTHELKSLYHTPDGKPTWRHTWLVGRNGSTYGSHSLGPALDWLDDRVARVSCMGTGVRTDPEHVMEDTVVMLCKTHKDALVKIRVDFLSNRPTRVYYSLQGTRGCYEATTGLGDKHKVWLADTCKGPHDWRPLSEFEEEFLPQAWRETSEEALRAEFKPGRRRIDYLVARDFVDCIVKDTEPPIDVYRALDFTVPDIISGMSIEQGGVPLPVPDFREFGTQGFRLPAGA